MKILCYTDGLLVCPISIIFFRNKTTIRDNYVVIDAEES